MSAGMAALRHVPDDALDWQFIRASGPGGQNVNKVASAVQLRCDLNACPELPERVRMRLKVLAGRRLTANDVMVITAQRLRTQEANKRDALTRLEEMLTQAYIEPRVRRATRPTLASKKRRLETKQQRGAIKRGRGSVKDYD